MFIIGIWVQKNTVYAGFGIIYGPGIQWESEDLSPANKWRLLTHVTGLPPSVFVPLNFILYTAA